MFRRDGTLHCQIAVSIGTGIVNRDRGAIHRHGTAENLRDGVPESFTSQVGDDGVVEFEKSAIALYAPTRFRSRLNALHSKSPNLILTPGRRLRLGPRRDGCDN